MTLEAALTRLTAKKARLDGLRPLSQSALGRLKSYFDVEWTYNSNAIEGSTLTLRETELAHIHPFADGNGRTARLLMNLLLARAGYPPAVLRAQDRLAYYEGLDAAHAGDPSAFIALVAAAVERSLEVVLEAHGA